MHHDDYNAHNTFSSFRARRLERNDEFIPLMRAKLGDLKDKQHMRTHLNLLMIGCALFAAAALLLVGRLSLQDELRQRNHYCHMVAQGYWPDFRHIAQSECRAAAPAPASTVGVQPGVPRS